MTQAARIAAVTKGGDDLKNRIDPSVAIAPDDRKPKIEDVDRWRRKTDEVTAADERRRAERERTERVRFDLD